MRTVLTLVALISVAVLPGCPGKRTAGGGAAAAAMPAAVAHYEALRWVPADVTWAFAGRRAADVSDVLRETVEVLGILAGGSAADASAASRAQLGYDLLSPDSVASIGVDVERGAALFGTSLSPTIAVALGDQAKLDAFVDRMREAGAALQSQISDGVEVYTLRFDRDVAISWAVVDGWILARAEILAERKPELAWLEGARAAHGAFAGSADFTAALDAARAHAPAISAGDGPPVVGVVRPGALLDAVLALADDRDRGEISACLAPMRDAARVLVAAGVGQGGAGGAIVADLADPSRWSATAAPGGWYAVRSGAPVQLDLGVDVPAFLRSLRGCPLDQEVVDGVGVRTVHVAAHSFDNSGMPTRAAAYTDLSTDAALRAMLNQIPGLSMASKRRRVGDVDVVDVSVPLGLAPDFTSHLSPARGFLAMGDGVVEAILGAGAAVDGELFHLDLRPHDVPTAAWHLLLEGAGVGRKGLRDQMIAQLRRWERGTIDVRLEGTRLVLTAAGTLRR